MKRVGHERIRRLETAYAGVLVLAAVCLLAPAAPAQIALHAEVDRTRITLEDQILLRVVIEGRFQSHEEPERPPLPDWEVYYRGRSQNIQIVNGEMDASITFTYALVPKREGKLRIEPFTLRYRGREYQSEPLVVEVGGRPPPQSESDLAREDRDLFVVARVDKKNAYVNEQVLYTFALYSAVRVSNLNYTAPKFEGFWVEKLQEGEKQYHKIINGRRYLVVEVTTAVFPTTSGTLKIEPGRLRLVELTERSFSFFDRGVERVLRSRPVEIEVEPLPAHGRPPHFEGAVGEDLSISARLDATEVEQGEPITLTVRVSGDGNVRTFSKPVLPELPQFKVYDSDSETRVRSRDRVRGSRTWEVVLVPLEAGEYRIPPVKLAYFDTEEARYRTVETKPMEVTAVRTHRTAGGPGAVPPPRRPQEIEVLGRDIEHIRTDVAVSDTRTPLFARVWFLGAMPVPLLALAGAWVVVRRRDRLEADVALARSSRARKMARKRLAQAARWLAQEESEAFYAEVARALQQYVGDKLNVSAIGMTHAALRARLQASGVSEDHRERLIQMLERCDAARFAPGSSSVARMRDTLQEVESLVVELEGAWNARARRARGTHVAAWLAVALGGLLLAGAGSARAQAVDAPPADFVPPAELLRQGHAAYERGDFAAAIAAYTRAESLGVRNGPLYYDLGNAYWKHGELGRAIAAYRRAEMLLPRDAFVRNNLAFVLERRTDKAVAPHWPFPFSVVRAVFRSLSLNEWIVVTAAWYVLACAIGLWRIVRRGGGWRTRVALVTAIAGLALSGAALATKAHVELGVDRGVVAVEKLPVRSGPGADYTVEFTIHEGTEFRIEARRPDWVRIALRGNLRGWVPARTVAPI